MAGAGEGKAKVLAESEFKRLIIIARDGKHIVHPLSRIFGHALENICEIYESSRFISQFFKRCYWFC